MATGTKRKVLEDFPRYEITSNGQIWDLLSKRYMKPFENVMKRRPKPYYLRIALMDRNGKRRKIMVHRLVALAFVENPKKKPFVNHKNGNKHDNNFDNLEWMTNQENCIHASENNLIRKKLSNEQVKQIRNDFADWSNQKIADFFHVSNRLIRMIKKGERRTYV